MRSKTERIARELAGDTSSPNKDAVNKYRHTEKGLAYVAEYNERDSAKEARSRYAKSERGKDTYRRYRGSVKGQAARANRQAKLERALLLADLEAQGRCGLCGASEHATEYHLRPSENGAKE